MTLNLIKRDLKEIQTAFHNQNIKFCDSQEQIFLDWLLNFNGIRNSVLDRLLDRYGYKFATNLQKEKFISKIFPIAQSRLLIDLKKTQMKSLQNLFSKDKIKTKSSRWQRDKIAGICVWTSDQELFMAQYKEIIGLFHEYNTPVIYRDPLAKDFRPNLFCNVNLVWVDQQTIGAQLKKLNPILKNNFTILIWNWAYENLAHSLRTLLGVVNQVWVSDFQLGFRIYSQLNRVVHFLPICYEANNSRLQSTSKLGKRATKKILLGYYFERYPIQKWQNFVLPQIKLLKKNFAVHQFTLYVDTSQAVSLPQDFSLVCNKIRALGIEVLHRDKLGKPLPIWSDFHFFCNINLTFISDPLTSSAFNNDIRIINFEFAVDVETVIFDNGLYEYLERRRLANYSTIKSYSEYRKTSQVKMWAKLLIDQALEAIHE